MPVVVGVFFFSFSTANNRAIGSRSLHVFSSIPLTRVHGSVEGWSRAGGGSYAGAPWPNPWRPVASAVVAPTSLSPSIFFNNFMVLIEVSPLLELDLGDLWMDFSIFCCLKEFTSVMQQVQTEAIIYLPSFAMVIGCGLSNPCLLCKTRWPNYSWLMCKILKVSRELQERSCTRGMGISPISCFSAQSVAIKREARGHGGDDFAEEMVVWLEAFVWHRDCSTMSKISVVATSLLMISENWYAKLNLLHIFIPGILDVRFQPTVFAAYCLEHQNWNNFLSVSSWSQVDFTDADFLDIYVHTDYINFMGSKNLGFGILWLQIDLNAKLSVNLELILGHIIASTIVIQERHFLRCSSCTCFSLSDDRHGEDAVSTLFGLFHRRWTTTPPLLIPKFNGGDTLSLSSVKDIRYLQLSSSPRVHIPDRLSGEPPAGHQLDRTFFEALEDCRCGNFESELSADERTPYGSICNLQRLLHEFRSPCCVVHLGTYLSCSTVESHVMMYHDL